MTPRKSSSSPRPASSEMPARSMIEQGAIIGRMVSSVNLRIERSGPTGQRAARKKPTSIGPVASNPQRIPSQVNRSRSSAGTSINQPINQATAISPPSTAMASPTTRLRVERSSRGSPVSSSVSGSGWLLMPGRLVCGPSRGGGFWSAAVAAALVFFLGCCCFLGSGAAGASQEPRKKSKAAATAALQNGRDQARMSLTTLPCTSVRRKSRPA